jgi:hypothetical protein
VAPQCPLQLSSHEHKQLVTIVVQKKKVILLIGCKTQDVLLWFVKSFNTYQIKDDTTYAHIKERVVDVNKHFIINVFKISNTTWKSKSKQINRLLRLCFKALSC